MKNTLLFVLLLSLDCVPLQSQSLADNCVVTRCNKYRIIEINDYTFKKLLDEGINTLALQLDVLHVPIRQFKPIIKWHIKRHRFELNKGKNRLKKTTFRAIAFEYPSVSPFGDTIMLSGLVTIPILNDNMPANIFVYHRIMASSYKIAPSNSIPLESVLTADNTICVFPDYYGCGITEGEPFAYTALNYHARCATECILTALNIIKDEGIELDDNYFTWNAGYSQGGGYALATHRYIETSLPDSLSALINLKWSLCGGGIYSPVELFKSVLTKGDMGSTPAVYLKGLQSILYIHKECLGEIQMSDYFSCEALDMKLDSLLLDHDESLWEVIDGHNIIVEKQDPHYYFSNMLLDTNSYLFKSTTTALKLDDCVTGWHPRSTVVFYHSKRDNCIPYRHALMVYSTLNDDNGSCFLWSPVINLGHAPTSVLFFAKLLRLREDKLYKKYTK